LRKAFDVATAAKANVEKSQKSALAKARKAEKDLADANKEHLQQEQAVAERLHTMSVAAGGTHSSCTLSSAAVAFLLILPFSCCFSVLFVVQNLPSCLYRLCNRAMILLWPRLTYSK
jgi:hypothetical protein